MNKVTRLIVAFERIDFGKKLTNFSVEAHRLLKKRRRFMRIEFLR
jgi:hypothetical protein